MPVVEKWRIDLWNKRAATKLGTPLEELRGISQSTYFFLRNQGVDTIQDLLKFINKCSFSTKFSRINKVIDCINASDLPELTDKKHEILQNKVKKCFRLARSEDETYISYSEEILREKSSSLLPTSIDLLRSIKYK